MWPHRPLATMVRRYAAVFHSARKQSTFDIHLLPPRPGVAPTEVGLSVPMMIASNEVGIT